MLNLQLPPDEDVYRKDAGLVFFNQLAVKIEMDSVSNEDYYAWLDRMTRDIGRRVPGAEIAEKPHAREEPPLNIAVYYDTADYAVLPTGSLLRTSCNRITHAFCAFKLAQDGHSVRRDHRYVFAGEEKRTIQQAPTSDAAVAIVRELLARTDIEHPGAYLRRHHGIEPTELWPAIGLDDLRYTFFVWLDGRDALRCSIDRATVYDLRLPQEQRTRRPVSEVELAIYPRIDLDMAKDPRLVDLIAELTAALQEQFDVPVTELIKYQRAARALDIRTKVTAGLSSGST